MLFVSSAVISDEGVKEGVLELSCSCRSFVTIGNRYSGLVALAETVTWAIANTILESLGHTAEIVAVPDVMPVVRPVEASTEIELDDPRNCKYGFRTTGAE